MLLKTWRWFGPNDRVTLRDVAQTGATGIVTALHHMPNGSVWSVDEILKTKKMIEDHHLIWEVVESLPVSEGIKQATSDRDQLIENYCQSIRNLGACGIRRVVYNFMPVLDWARTDLEYHLENGAETMYFDYPTFVAFDCFLLKRPNAQSDYPAELVDAARQIADRLTSEQADRLVYNIIIKTQSFIDGVVDGKSSDPKGVFLSFLDRYRDINDAQLYEHLRYFLQRVIPVAEESGVVMAIHPDDPPFPLLGLPRIVKNSDDLQAVLDAFPSVSNGLNFCTGSLGVNPDNDLPSMIRRFGPHIHFLHLRNLHLGTNRSFYEAGHLDGDLDMAAILSVAIDEQLRRKGEGRNDWMIPVRPDHGLKILSDFHRDDHPGYPLVGRMKGLAQLEGLAMGLAHAKMSTFDR